MIKPHKYSSGCQHSSLLKFESDLFKAEQENTGKKSFISNFQRERERKNGKRKLELWHVFMLWRFFPLSTAEFSLLNR